MTGVPALYQQCRCFLPQGVELKSGMKHATSCIQARTTASMRPPWRPSRFKLTGDEISLKSTPGFETGLPVYPLITETPTAHQKGSIGGASRAPSHEFH